MINSAIIANLREFEIGDIVTITNPNFSGGWKEPVTIIGLVYDERYLTENIYIMDENGYVTTDFKSEDLTLHKKFNKPVAYLQHENRLDTFGASLSFHALTEADKKYGWRETPLYK